MRSIGRFLLCSSAKVSVAQVFAVSGLLGRKALIFWVKCGAIFVVWTNLSSQLDNTQKKMCGFIFNRKKEKKETFLFVLVAASFEGPTQSDSQNDQVFFIESWTQ